MTRKVQRTVEIEEVVSRTCDICKGPVESASAYASDDVRVQREVGEDFRGDGGELELVEFDVCGTCFNDKLVPFMLLHGAQPRVTKKEW